MSQTFQKEGHFFYFETMSVEQAIQRCVLRIVIFFLRIGNVVDSFLNYFGIKLLRINRESVLKGLSFILQKSLYKVVFFLKKKTNDGLIDCHSLQAKQVEK